MTDPLGSLVDALASLIDHLERVGIDYAIGGAVSYSAWAEPRATRDIDLTSGSRRSAWTGHSMSWPRLVCVSTARLQNGTQPSAVRLAHRDTWVPSPETLAVFKMLFYRPKDLVDVQRLLEIQGDQMDRAFIRAALVDMLGPGDERLRTWDDLVVRTTQPA